MSSEKDKQDKQHKDAAVQPDPETLHKTDPQENMKGPLSSLVNGVAEKMDEGESKEEADEKKEKNM
ncbi:MAG: hypothetical protein JWQ27_2745 [Ferruginibacter sp.]|nr:hypothetical protein [Ferruginibacter sp.]